MFNAKTWRNRQLTIILVNAIVLSLAVSAMWILFPSTLNFSVTLILLVALVVIFGVLVIGAGAFAFYAFLALERWLVKHYVGAAFSPGMSNLWQFLLACTFTIPALLLQRWIFTFSVLDTLSRSFGGGSESQGLIIWGVCDFLSIWVGIILAAESKRRFHSGKDRDLFRKRG